jgi:hypothetical protein
MGRPTKLTPEIKEKLILAVQAGNYREAAAAYAGIAPATLYNWLEKGKNGKRGPYVELLESIKVAEGEAEARIVLSIRTKIPDDPNLGLRFLERRYAARWSQRSQVTHAGELGLRHEPPLAERLAGNADALQRYNDFLAALTRGPAGGEPGSPGDLPFP